MSKIERGLTVRVAEFKPHPMNYNAHPQKQIKALRESLRIFEQVRDVVVWREFIIAGHGVVEAAKAEEWTEISATRLPDDWDEERVLAYLAVDNETARMSEPDDAQLAALLQGVSDEELRALAAGGERRLRELMGTEMDDPGPQVDKAEELRQKWGVEAGQLWQLREHRLICGDCTDAMVIGRVMNGEKGDFLLTDPPYNVGIEYGAGANDRKTIEQNEQFINKWFGQYKMIPVKVITPGVGYYMGTLRSYLTLFPPRWMCIWFRRNSMSHSPLRGFAAWEPILFYDNEEQDSDTEWGGVLVYGKPEKAIGQDVFDIPIRVQPDVTDEEGNKYHPTPKPLELFVILLRRFLKDGQTVVDPFLGSGTTLMACEYQGRQCRAIELNAGYVAASLERFYQATGIKPQLVE